MMRRMPPSAKVDLAEWTHDGLQADIGKVLGQELPIAKVLPERASIRITDDQPYNEYFLVRRFLAR